MKQKIKNIPKVDYDDDDIDDDDEPETINLDDIMEVGDIKEETLSESGYDSNDVST